MPKFARAECFLIIMPHTSRGRGVLGTSLQPSTLPVRALLAFEHSIGFKVFALDMYSVFFSGSA